jgi:hypothetical protein
MVLDRFLGVRSQLLSLEIVINRQTAGRCLRAKIQSEDGNLVVEDDIEEGAVHVDAPVVLHEAELPELIHEETHP